MVGTSKRGIGIKTGWGDPGRLEAPGANAIPFRPGATGETSIHPHHLAERPPDRRLHPHQVGAGGGRAAVRIAAVPSELP